MPSTPLIIFRGGLVVFSQGAWLPIQQIFVAVFDLLRSPPHPIIPSTNKVQWVAWQYLTQRVAWQFYVLSYQNSDFLTTCLCLFFTSPTTSAVRLDPCSTRHVWQVTASLFILGLHYTLGGVSRDRGIYTHRCISPLIYSICRESSEFLLNQCYRKRIWWQGTTCQ